MSDYVKRMNDSNKDMKRRLETIKELIERTNKDIEEKQVQVKNYILEKNGLLENLEQNKNIIELVKKYYLVDF